MSAGDGAAAAARPQSEPVSLQMALQATIADLMAKGYDPRDSGMLMFGSDADREAWCASRGIPDPFAAPRDQEAGQ